MNNTIITIITEKGFENTAIPTSMLKTLNDKLKEGKTEIHTAERTIECYGYIIHAKGSKNRLMFIGNEGSGINE